MVAENEGGDTEASEAQGAIVTIKKYANRRLYNTATSSYVTLDHLSEMVREGVDFVVLDAKTGDDITRSVLTQIIFEQESKGQSMLPVQFLRRLIRFYGDSMQGYLPPFLEMSMESFTKGQEQMRESLSRTFGGRTPIAAFEEQARQNMQIFQQAMQAWAPFNVATRPAGEADEPDAKDQQLADLKRQMEAMQKQLETIAGRKPGA